MEEEKLMEDEAKKAKREERQGSGGAKVSAPTLNLNQKLSQHSQTELTQSS